MSAPVGGLTLRSERADDAPAVRVLLEEAFTGTAEALLVERLRAAGELVLALVAIDGLGTLVGFAGFARVEVEGAACPCVAAALAPLAVRASHRRRGIGSALVQAGLEHMVARREQVVFVLGEPMFYGRLGFSLEDASGFASTYQGPHFMACRLAADAPRIGRLRYPTAFDDLG